MKRKINFKGNPLTLTGRMLEEGNLAPDFKTVSQDLKEVSLSDFAGRTKIITSFPSENWGRVHFYCFMFYWGKRNVI